MVVSIAFLSWSTSAIAQHTRTDHFDGAITTLRRCASGSTDGEHHALIVSLRALKDPALQPFFESLRKSTHWSSRIDGILGLAELSADREINPTFVAELPAVEDRSTAIRNGVGLRLMSPNTIRTLLKSSGLPVLDRVVLNAELHRHGESFDPSQLREAAADPSDEIAGLAAALLFEAGNEGAWEAFAMRLSLRTPEIRNLAMAELARAVLLYGLSAPIRSMVAIVADPAFSAQTRMIVNGSALVLDPAVGQAAWKRFTQQERGQSALVRAGLQAMAQEKGLEAGLGSSIRNGEPLVEAIADAIEANASNDPKALASSLEVVIDRANRQSAEWAVRRAAALPAPFAAEVWKHLLVRFLTAPVNAPALSSAVLDCASRLAVVDPPSIEALVVASASETQLQEMLILALCSAATPEAAGVAERVRGSLTRRGDALAVLAIARGNQKLSAEGLAALGVVAAGGGDLDPTLLVQAAWLFARHSGKSQQALSQMHPK